MPSTPPTWRDELRTAVPTPTRSGGAEIATTMFSPGTTRPPATPATSRPVRATTTSRFPSAKMRMSGAIALPSMPSASGARGPTRAVHLPTSSAATSVPSGAGRNMRAVSRGV